jgi:hypothetical protein
MQNRYRMRNQLYKKGQSGNPKGKQKGVVSKFTTLKAAFLNVFERAGGEDGLLEWVNASNHNKAAFYQWITKMLPADVNVGNTSDADGKTQALLIKVVHTKDGDPGNGNGNGDK